MEELEYRFEKRDDGSEVAKLIPEKEKNRLKQLYRIRLRSSGIPLTYWPLNWDCFAWDKSKTAVDNCKLFTEHFDDKRMEAANLYLYGLNTSGKTTIMCAIGKDLIKRGKQVRFILAGQLTNLLIELNKTEEMLKRIEDLKAADLILIDDAFDSNKSLMWKGESKHIIIAVWDQFLRDCISNRTRIVITSNVKLSEIRMSYGTSMYELLERSFLTCEFLDKVEGLQTKNIESVFDMIRVESQINPDTKPVRRKGVIQYDS